ncbi:ATP-binding protein [Adhaeribacter aquaticus]|uniref:ATP-binding protein n=1 Tax=Adhaeribacter aquaticus TaxID=299567 RepID=UPI00042918BD|nr:ATP-binding protein [Adhaeribacter aquaticus]
MNNSIRISSNKNNLKVVRDFVTDFLHPYGLSAIVLNQIILAVDEITANLIIHANHEDNNKFIKLTIEKLDDTFLFEISDKGRSFNQANYKEPDIKDHIRIGKKGGVGIALVRRIMDKVEFTTDQGTNVCRLYKKVG